MDGFEYALVALRLSYHDHVVYPDGTSETVGQGEGPRLVQEWSAAWEAHARRRFAEEVLPATHAEFARRMREWEAAREAREADFRDWRGRVEVTDIAVELPSAGGLLRRPRREPGKAIAFPDGAVVQIRPRPSPEGKPAYDLSTDTGAPAPAAGDAPGAPAASPAPPRRVYLPGDLAVVSLSSFEVERVIRRVYDGGHPLPNKPVEAVPEAEEWLARQREHAARPEVRESAGWSGVIRTEQGTEPIALGLATAEYGVPDALVVEVLNRMGRGGWEVISVNEDKALSVPSRLRFLLGRLR